MTTPVYSFCPHCGIRLDQSPADGSQKCSHCHWVKYLHTPQVAVCVVTNHNHVLLCQRAHEPFKNLWSLPGGFAQYGELPCITASRELKEETSIAAKSWAHISQYLSDQHPLTESLVTGIAVKTDTLEMAASDDAVQVQWFDYFSLPPLAFTCHFQILEDYFLLEEKLRFQPLPTKSGTLLW